MCLIIVVICLRSLAAIFAKKAAVESVGLGVYGLIVNVWLLAELVTLAAQALVWLIILRRTALTVAYPALSLAFVLNLLAAWLIFDETILLQHMLGVLIIVIGVTIVNLDRN